MSKSRYIITIDDEDFTSVKYGALSVIGHDALAERITEAFQCSEKYEEISQGECKTCRHRDPEDKKCDCGALERAGCPFPVSDDYFCKFYEKGGAE